MDKLIQVFKVNFKIKYLDLHTSIYSNSCNCASIKHQTQAKPKERHCKACGKEMKVNKCTSSKRVAVLVHCSNKVL